MWISFWNIKTGKQGVGGAYVLLPALIAITGICDDSNIKMGRYIWYSCNMNTRNYLRYPKMHHVWFIYSFNIFYQYIRRTINKVNSSKMYVWLFPSSSLCIRIKWFSTVQSILSSYILMKIWKGRIVLGKITF